jgi:hypothetical protein
MRRAKQTTPRAVLSRLVVRSVAQRRVSNHEGNNETLAREVACGDDAGGRPILRDGCCAASSG